MLRLIVVFALCSIAASQVPSSELLTKSISKFSWDLYQQCAQTTEGNMIISPFSVAKSLALLSQGASGETYEQIKSSLHLELGKVKTANQFRRRTRLLRRGARRTTLSVANSIYLQQGYTINRRFQDIAVQKFVSGVDSVNFANSLDASRTINTFVENKTKGKIKDLIKPSMLNSDTRVVLVNAIYFKGDWEQKFDLKRTQKSEFQMNGIEKVSTDFMSMHREFNYGYFDDLEASALEMKYANSNLSMVFVLPNSVTGLPTLEDKMKNFESARIVSTLEPENIDVSIPKFKVEYEIKLNDVLKNMGMTDMFTTKADFTGILATNDKLFVSDVVHKAFIEVNEDGAEAAAATGIALMDRMLPPSFNCDHPFLYFIWDNISKTTVFSGRITTFKQN
ncbi:serine protease inhibitor 42Dd-like [Sitodiplosis mosellana]|uniref:serine protease inhibitor 42Dd-like n=1 Tax=Sitodiplosis mosellana TaxID=263140 RepID=UPI0024441ED5|nr:serine protease inhibitor 42Dd-like [Sitodiplosis mosellana]XP_055310174.1 serine protease inhibitor 42Dd-like [Sitodiplosis mosellana]